MHNITPINMCDILACRYELNTLVESPHRRQMNDLKFRPRSATDTHQVLVTTSCDGDFKTWTLTDDNDIYS